MNKTNQVNISVRMNKKQGILLGIALMLLLTGIALATSSASSDIEIYAFDQNPAGYDSGNEWVTLYNPSNESVDKGNWTLDADGERETISDGTTLYPGVYYVYSPPYQWLDNSNEAITLSDTKGEEWTLSDYLQLGMLVATFLAILAALFGEIFREWIKKPKISVKFDQTSDRCFRKAIVPTDSIQPKRGSFFKDVERCYYRLEVRNNGGLAKNVKLKIDILDSEEKEVQYFEPSLLNWISGKESENLARGEVNYVNICSQVLSHENHINRRLRAELFNTSPRGIIRDLPLDNYIFKITVHGDNFKPKSQQFKFIKPSSNIQPGNLIKK